MSDPVVLTPEQFYRVAYHAQRIRAFQAEAQLTFERERAAQAKALSEAGLNPAANYKFDEPDLTATPQD
jgi:hypothetical protein